MYKPILNAPPIVSASVVLAILILASLLGSYHSRQEHIDKAIVVLKNRVALDLFDLGLETESSQISQDNRIIQFYIRDLNRYLELSSFPIKMEGIMHYHLEEEIPADSITIELHSSRNIIPIQITVDAPWVKPGSIILCIFFAVAYLGLVSSNQKRAARSAMVNSKEVIKKVPKLIVDLRERSLYLSSNPEQIAQLSNKPLCFYLAMLTYCCENKEPQLFHNKQLPEDFIALANKYFSRLLELGHSRRKRPDFDNNIDKMLSEIRTALDEIISAEPEVKEIFFPQKAQGEGSRSKLHNFALLKLKPDSYELIGN